MHEWRFHQTGDGDIWWWEFVESGAREVTKCSQRQFSSMWACIGDAVKHGYDVPSIVSVKAHMH